MASSAPQRSDLLKARFFPNIAGSLPLGACIGKHLMKCCFWYQHPPTDIENRN
jgi:hypothetical protein